MTGSPLGLALAIAVGWLAIGALGLVAPRRLGFVARVLFPLGAALGAVLAGVALGAIATPPHSYVAPLGLPDLPFHFRMDALSAFFLLLLGAVSAGVSVFAAGYIRPGEGTAPGLQCLWYHLFLASMAFVLVADDAYAFMVAWESMALASFFLVTSDHRQAEIRRAGYLYLLIAHVGAIAILLCFGVLQGVTHDYAFGAMRAVELPPSWATVAFLLALFGFGAKAGILPLHAWLPEAHPAAPSPVSALMSAVMLKTAIYGMLRVTFDLLHVQIWWWGAIALAVGLATAIFGVAFSAVQSDMKRLLAYSSIENIGFVVTGFGLTITFAAYGMPALAALALTATLYHCLNHACFKSLLFLATGSVLHATRERALGKLGGLIHRMPWVAWTALVGALAIAGLPPLNGFVSEWLLLQAFLFTPELPDGYLNMLVPLAAAAIALAAALSAYVMVKFYGVVFLGQPREEIAQAHDAGVWERVGLVWLAIGCVALGLLPVQVIGLIDHVTGPLVGKTLSAATARSHWIFLAPIDPQRASYSPLLFVIGLVVVTLAAWLAVRRFYHGRVRRAPPWDCGFPLRNPRMQDTAEGFGQPVRVVFEPFFRVVEREVPGPADAAPRYRMVIEDPLWRWVYLPIARIVDRVTGLATVLQRGRISVYLMFSFATLLVLLFFVR
jgi:hydrogenase-4 component B